MSKNLTRRVEDLEANRREHRAGRELYRSLPDDPPAFAAAIKDLSEAECESVLAYLGDLHPRLPDVSGMTLEQLDALKSDLEAQLAEEGDDPPAAALT